MVGGSPPADATNDAPAEGLERNSTPGRLTADASTYSVEQDAFGVGTIVDRLSDLISDAEPPIAIALSGPWGSGKTTVADGVMHRLRAHDQKACTVDLWVEDIATLRQRLVVEIGAEMAGKSREQVAARLDRRLRSSTRGAIPVNITWTRRSTIAAIVVAALVVLRVFVWHLLPQSIASALVALIEGIAQITDRILAYPTVQPGLLIVIGILLVRSRILFVDDAAVTDQVPIQAELAIAEELRETIAIPDGHPKVPVLVVIDNLDRLSPDEALSALSEIRAFVEVPRSCCVFLIPIDRKVFVKQAKSRFGGDDSMAADYLTKFFNYDVRLTEPQAIDLRDFCSEAIAENLGGESASLSVRGHAQIVVSAARGSPRSAKRIIKGAAARYALLGRAADTAISVDQVLFLECLTQQFAQAIPAILDDPPAFVELREALPGSANRPLVLNTWLSKGALTMEAGVASSFQDFLLANSGVALSASNVYRGVTLREQVFWKGITRPDLVERALSAGNSVEMAQLFEQAKGDDLVEMIDRAILWIDDSLRRQYLTNAVNGLNALSPLGLPDRQKSRLRAVGFDLMTQQATDLTLMSESSIGLILDGSADHRVSAIWEIAKNKLGGAASFSTPIGGLVSILKASARQVDAQRHIDAQQELSRIIDHPEFDVLLMPPVALELLDNAVHEALLVRIANWMATQSDSASAVHAARALTIIATAGRTWDTTATTSELLEHLQRLGQGLSPTQDLDTDAELVLESVAQLLAASPANRQTPALISALASWEHPARPQFVAMGLGLPRTSDSGQTLINVLQEAFAESSPEMVRDLVQENRAQLIVLLPTLAGGLVERWATEGWALLLDSALTLDPEADDHIGTRLAAVPDISFVARGQSAIAAVANTSAPSLLALAQALIASALRRSGLPVDAFEPIFDDLRSLEVHVPLPHDIILSIASNPAGLDRIAEASLDLVQISDDGGEGLRANLIARVVELRYLPLGAASWLVAGADGETTKTLREILSTQIREGASAIGELGVALPRLTTPFHRHGSIGLSLVLRTAAASCEDANALLALASNWPPRRATDRDQATAAVRALLERCPDSNDAAAWLTGG